MEQGHLGKTEIFCKFDPQNPEAAKAVEDWHEEQARAFKEHYFALLMGPTDKIGPDLCNFNLWWSKIHRRHSIPNGVSPEAGALVVATRLFRRGTPAAKRRRRATHQDAKRGI